MLGGLFIGDKAMTSATEKVASHTSRDDPKTVFDFDEVSENGATHYEVSCLKLRSDGDWDVHWLLRFKDRDKAQAEFNRWLTS